MDSSKLIGCGTFTRIDDDMTWPSVNIENQEWLLRYGSPDDVLKNRYIYASVVAAYNELVNMQSDRRDYICDALLSANDPGVETKIITKLPLACLK